MKGFQKTLKDVFRPVASALGAVSVAIALLAGSIGPAEAKVMDKGPTSVVLKQLESDGYQPVGAGLTTDKKGHIRLVSIWKDAGGEWIATSGNKSTTEVAARGSGLTTGTWSPTSSISYEQTQSSPHGAAGAGSRCIPFDMAVDRVLSRQFVKANVMTGTMSSGAELRIYEEDGKWLAVRVQDDEARTTCPVDTGYGFKFSGPSAS